MHEAVNVDRSFEETYRQICEQREAGKRRAQYEAHRKAEETLKWAAVLPQLEAELRGDISKFRSAMRRASNPGWNCNWVLGLGRRYWVLFPQAEPHCHGEETTGEYRSGIALDTRGRLWWVNTSTVSTINNTELSKSPQHPWEPTAQAIRSAMANVLVAQNVEL